MLRVRVLWFGHPARSPYEESVEDYRRRVARRWPAEDIARRPHPRSGRTDAARARAREAASVLEGRPNGWHLIALDERGRAPTSAAFAGRLARLEEGPAEGALFVIGSDLGLHPSLRDEADEVLSLGPLTLPHLLSRLLLWEQLYRATDILGAGRYHRSG